MPQSWIAPGFQISVIIRQCLSLRTRLRHLGIQTSPAKTCSDWWPPLISPPVAAALRLQVPFIAGAGGVIHRCRATSVLAGVGWAPGPRAGPCRPSREACFSPWRRFEPTLGYSWVPRPQDVGLRGKQGPTNAIGLHSLWGLDPPVSTAIILLPKTSHCRTFEGPLTCAAVERSPLLPRCGV